MHYIQKHILDSLRTVDSMHYAQLNQDEIESGHFRYHLSQLVKDGSVAQIQRGVYQLTPDGKRLVDKLSEHRVNAMAMPKVITYTLLTDGSKLLLQEKQKEPYRHLLNMIGGKLHEGESSVVAAIREVREKTGVHIDRPELAGVFEVIVREGTTVFTHAVAYVYRQEVSAASFADARLTAIDTTALSKTRNLAPDFMPVFTALQSNPGSVQVQTVELEL